ncbi:hypothetical protein [Segatella copri]|uniref:hypothetical protein n=1 Tax=Segatella copri TaxID=165179 RepID=UPI0022E1A3BA|nr:hypothetical protein [Segatella copri]
MIDDNKIETAKEEIYDDKFLGCGEMVEAFKDEDEQEMFDKEDIKEAIGLGAKWAINESLKDLWYPASEEPKKAKNLILETTYEYGKPIYHLIKYMPNGNNVCAWKEWYKGAHLSRWLYIDDLLPKEGGEQ